MKNLVITSLLTLICLTTGYAQTTSQTPIRIWKVGTTSVFVANPATDPPLSNPVATYGSATEYNVEVSLVNPGGIWVRLNGKYSRYTPDKFLNKNFTPWGATAAEAVEAYLLSGSSSQSITPGTDGKTILSGTIAPSSGVGTDGDYYYNRTTTTFYGPKASGSWPTGIVLVGPTGATGATGSQGATGATGSDGKTVRNGTVAPTSGIGVDGDFYINTATNILYGPKASGAWPTGVSLVGPQGPTGPSGTGTMSTKAQAIYANDSTTAMSPKRVGEARASHIVSAPATLFQTAMAGYTQPEIGSATLSHTRGNETLVFSSTGVISPVASGTAAYNWNVSTGRTMFKSTNGTINIYPGTAAKARDLTQTGWTLVNASATKDQTGMDGVAASATSLSATSANATALYTQTVTAANRWLSMYIKRLMGGGRIWITQDGGTTLTDVTTQVTTTGFTRVTMYQSVLNPSFGIKLENSGDIIAVDYVNLADGAYLIDPGTLSQGVSALTYSALSPSIVNGRRYRLSFNTKVLGTGVSVKVQEGLTSNNYIQASINSTLTGWLTNVNALSAVVYSSNPNVTYQPIPAYNQLGQDIKVEMEWGLGKAVMKVNNYITTIRDMTAAASPVNLDRIILAGAAYFADLKIEELFGFNILLFGDSITASPNYPDTYYVGLDQTNYNVHPRGIGGNRIADLVARYSTDVTPSFHTRADRNIVVLWIGTNDIAAGTSGADALTALGSLINTIHAGGWEVYCMTTLPRSAILAGGVTTASFLTQATIYNNGLKSVAGADAVIDLRAVAETLDSTNLTYYLDGVHPTNALYKAIWPTIRRALP